MMIEEKKMKDLIDKKIAEKTGLLKKDFRIQGKKTYLIPFDENHLNNPRYLEWLRDYEVMKTIGRQEYLDKQVSFEEAKDYVENVWKSDNNLFLALYCKEDDTLVGTMKLININWLTRIVDIGIMIGDKKYWGRGLASDAVAAVSKYCFDYLRMRKLTAGAMSVNVPMIKVFKKLGFVEEGVFRKRDLFEGKYVDHIYLGCFIEEFKSTLKAE